MLQALAHTFRYYRSRQTGLIKQLPVVILMPHSACNCRCVMCDIWKANSHARQLTENDISGLMHTLQKMGTRQVLMSGGEALLHPNFFRLCAILKKEGISVSLHSTGLLLQKYSEELLQGVDDIIVSLDGDAETHNQVRNIPNAFEKMCEGIQALRQKNASYKISGRTVIHKYNFRKWGHIIDTARSMGLDRISFLPADVSSNAFSRETAWDENRQHEIVPGEEELVLLKSILDELVLKYKKDFETGFIAETPEKLYKIYEHYAAYYYLALPPFKTCNAPWVSVVVEADGAVRPCFFHEAYGNINDTAFEDIINSPGAVRFRKNLDMASNITCVNCVCYLNLRPGAK